MATGPRPWALVTSAASIRPLAVVGAAEVIAGAAGVTVNFQMTSLPTMTTTTVLSTSSAAFQ
jgi:hypothetical protein